MAATLEYLPANQARYPNPAIVLDMVAIFFITGRGERDRLSTERNLQQAGYTGYKQLICRPPGLKGTTGSYKTSERRRLIEGGYTIVINLGDQASDLEGGYNGAAFKLPNPMYYVP